MKTKLIITENQLKTILKEYDYETFDLKYGDSFPKDRKEKLVNWARERQFNRSGIELTNDDGVKLYITPKDIRITQDEPPFLKNFKQELEIRKERHIKYTLKNFLDRHRYVNFNFYADNALLKYSDGTETDGTVHVEINVEGELTPMTDKDNPTLKFVVMRVEITNSINSSGRFIPTNRKQANLLTNIIKKVFLEKFGKYSMPKLNDSTLYIPEIEIHPNSLMAF